MLARDIDPFERDRFATAAKMWKVSRPPSWCRCPRSATAARRRAGRGRRPWPSGAARTARAGPGARPSARHRRARSRARRSAPGDRTSCHWRGRSTPARRRLRRVRRAAARGPADRSTPARTREAVPGAGAYETRRRRVGGHSGSGHGFRTPPARRVAVGCAVMWRGSIRAVWRPDQLTPMTRVLAVLPAGRC